MEGFYPPLYDFFYFTKGEIPLNCVKCGGPLPINSDVCEYCGILNDTDLRRLYDVNIEEEGVSEKLCPRCKINLDTMKLVINKNFFIERCKNCLGIFFDPLELEDLLTVAIEEDNKCAASRLGIMTEVDKDKWPVKYLNCPVCKNLMLRKSYGNLSGVIIDWCKPHGIWLDGGELGTLLKWVRSGYHKQAEFEKVRAEFSRTFEKSAIQINREKQRYKSEKPDRTEITPQQTINQTEMNRNTVISPWGKRYEPEIPDKTEITPQPVNYEIPAASCYRAPEKSDYYGDSDFASSGQSYEVNNNKIESPQGNENINIQGINQYSQENTYDQTIQTRNTSSRRLEISPEDEAFIDNAMMFFSGFVKGEE